MRPYVLQAGEGRLYDWSGILFAIKAGTRDTNGALAVIEYQTKRGEEPETHTHPDEDEIFYVLSGSMTFRCGRRSFDVEKHGFVFLPRGIPHGYTIRSRSARLLVITSPSGFADHIEADAVRVRSKR